MVTVLTLKRAINKAIAALPAVFPFDISIATKDDRFDILALVNSHCATLTTACSWDKMQAEGADGMERLRSARIVVLSRRKGNLEGMIAYTPGHDTILDHAAIAADESLTLRNQLRALYALMVPVYRASIELGYTHLVSRTFPLDDRMLVLAGALRDQLPVSVAEHRLDGEKQPISHWSFKLPLPAALDTIKVLEGL